jgi:hypothetical protein
MKQKTDDNIDIDYKFSITTPIQEDIYLKTLKRDRPIPIERTLGIVIRLKSKLEHYKKYFPTNIAFNSQWNMIIEYLIPENVILDINNPYSQRFIQNNNNLLDNKILTFNQAYFLYLGLNALYLTENTTYAKKIPNLYNQHQGENHFLDEFLLDEGYLKIRGLAFNTIGDIKGKELMEWMVGNGFLIVDKEFLNPKTKEKLYKELTNNNLITGELNEKWQWIGERNKLPYLAKQLRQKRILGDNCHKELSIYILDTNPDIKKPLKNIENPAEKAKNIIDDIVEKLPS